MWAGQQCPSSTTGADGDSETGCVRRWGGFPGRSVAYRERALWERSWASLSSSGTTRTWEPTRGCPSRRAASAAGGHVRRRPIASGRDGASVEGARSGKPATWRREAAGQQHWDWNARRSLMNIGDLWPNVGGGVGAGTGYSKPSCIVGQHRPTRGETGCGESRTSGSKA